MRSENRLCEYAAAFAAGLTDPAILAPEDGGAPARVVAEGSDGLGPAPGAGGILKPPPAAWIIRSPYPAVAIFAMNRTDDPVSPLCSSEPEDALVARPEQGVEVSRVPAGGATFLIDLLEGASLSDAVAAAFQEAPSFDLQANLAGMISAGLCTAVQHGDCSRCRTNKT